MSTHRYPFAEVEPKWQRFWEERRTFRAEDFSPKPKFYCLDFFPYPSGSGLHVGHLEGYTATDMLCRYKRMRGFNVLHCTGWDAFGLPAEQYAVKTGIHPSLTTAQNIETFRRQMKRTGLSHDWEREVDTTDPAYYRWTQWIFLKLFERGLAYVAEVPVNWCPELGTVLANEEVVDGRSEVGGFEVVRRPMRQWVLKITAYAERLLDDLALVDWPASTLEMQRNWIGRSIGAEVDFALDGVPGSLRIFTTRPDTLFGATFMVLAPEHPLVAKLTAPDRKHEVDDYVAQAGRQSDIDREATDKEKTGVFIGAYAVNPVNGARVPIWIADYVLMSYGTGAIMAVPAHDERDFAFAKKYDLPIPVVIAPPGWDGEPLAAAWPGDGTVVNSGPWNGAPAGKGPGQSVEVAVRWLEKNGKGKGAVSYKLRDWLISRQRYWGAPIPMVRCADCGWLPVPDDQLPVLLPDDVEWKPTGESPLKLHPTWKNTVCPQCGKPAERETDTMDTFMCSSWYHLRYLSPHYAGGAFDDAEYNYWMPVDTYTGGIEHATMHLIYTRFFHKALRDMGIVEGPEPMLQLRNQGIVLGEDSEKMSKSRGNTVPPDELVASYGADTVRAYLMFFARWDMGAPWNPNGIEGTWRWLRRVWSMFTEEPAGEVSASVETRRTLLRKVHQTLRSVTRDYESFEFNTIISSLMELLNEMSRAREAGAIGTPEWDEARDYYLRMLAPVAPHLAEELWSQLGKPYSVHAQPWPLFSAQAAAEQVVTLAVQVNGKLRARITVPAGTGEAQVREAALADPAVQKALEGQAPRQVIVVPGRLVNIVR